MKSNESDWYMAGSLAHQAGPYNKAYAVIGVVNSCPSGYSCFSGYFSSSGGSYPFVIGSGNVGIGTTNPGGKLDVADSFLASIGHLIIRPQDGTNEGGEIVLQPAGTHTAWNIDNYAGRLRFYHDGTEYVNISADGNVGIGTNMSGDAPGGSWGKLNVKGDVKITGSYFCGQSFDVAETYPVGKDSVRFPKEGDVVEISESDDEMVRVSVGKRFNHKVIGIVSSNPGMLLGGTDMNKEKEVAVALAGRVPACVTDENGPVRKGDLLVTSSTPGCLMRAEPKDILPGTLVGKALESLKGKKGLVMVYVD